MDLDSQTNQNGYLEKAVVFIIPKNKKPALAGFLFVSFKINVSFFRQKLTPFQFCLHVQYGQYSGCNPRK